MIKVNETNLDFGTTDGSVEQPEQRRQQNKHNTNKRQEEPGDGSSHGTGRGAGGMVMSYHCRPQSIPIESDVKREFTHEVIALTSQ